MGSLPNLTAIGCQSDPSISKRHYCRAGSRCTEEENFQLTHRPLRATRSAGSNKQYGVNVPLDKLDIKLLKQHTKESTFSPLSTRSTCQHAHRHHSHIQHPLVTNISKQNHRDSMSTSGGSTIGTSSVKRLINVVRSTQPNIGPVYSSKKLCKNFTALCLGHAMITAALIPLYTLQSSLSIWGGSYAMGRSNFNVYDTKPFNNHEEPVYYINNQSIWKQAGAGQGNMNDVRIKREMSTNDIDNTVYRYWTKQYKGDGSETNSKVKQKIKTESGDVIYNVNELKGDHGGKKLEKSSDNMIDNRMDDIEWRMESTRWSADETATNKPNQHAQTTKTSQPGASENFGDKTTENQHTITREIEPSETIVKKYENELLNRRIFKRSKLQMRDLNEKIKTGSKLVKRNEIPTKNKVISNNELTTNSNSITDDEDEDGMNPGKDVYRTIHNVDNGSLLLALLFFVGAISTVYSPFYVQKFGIKSCFVQCYSILCLFISSHYFPNVYILIFTYTLFGLFIGILAQTKIQFLMTLANKFSMVMSNSNEDFLTAQFTILQQLLRLYTLSQDIGVMLGGVLTFTVLYTNLKNYNIDYLFQYKDSGEKVCGSSYCPVIWSYLPSDVVEEDSARITDDLSQILTSNSNETHIDRVNKFLTSISYTILPCKANSLLLSIYLGFTIISVIMSIIFIDRIKNSFNYRTSGMKRLRICSIYSTYFRYIELAVKDYRLQLTAPLSLFIGLEQGFMYSDFMKSYVSCVIGTVNIPMVLVSSSVLQSVAAFTLSMLFQHVKRLYVMLVGFAFHACLILVLVIWLPAQDDAALLYVISSAWGVCNSIWNGLVFNVLFDLYPEYWQGPFAHSFFFRYLGLALSFGLHECVCNSFKFYALTLALGLSVMAFSCLEVNIKAAKREPFMPLPAVLTQQPH
uniref:Protein unc-93 homolog A n=2 Tax=Cacopsylla melanoneura TaxID=428564 RepID=A0A8D9E3C5_9HEMI